MKHPAVTIGLPVYNGAAYLDKALASITAQTFQNMEILVSDNASTDTTPEIISKYAAQDNRIRVHRQSENIGALRNYVWLLENAAAPWIKFAAYDDVLTPNYVEVLYKLGQEFPEAQLIATHTVLIRPDGTVYKDTHFPMQANVKQGLERIKILLKEVRSGWIYGLFRRDSLAAAWHESERFKYAWGQDFLVLLPFLLSGTVVGTNDATFYQLDTGISKGRYRPKTLAGQAHMYFSYLYECLRAVWRSSLTSGQKLILIPRVVVYAGQNSWKFRKLILHTLRYPFMPVKRILSKKNLSE